MKKQISIFASLIISLAAMGNFSSIAFAATGSHINQVITVSDEKEFKKSDAPILVIESSSDHTKDFQFSLKLTNAEWTYGESGEIAQGVTYEKATNEWLVISVDTNTFDAKMKDIKIPMLCKVTKSGFITVDIESDGSTVSSRQHTFANYIDGEITSGVNRVEFIYDKGKLDNFIINDTMSSSVKSGTKIKLSLDNGFKFTNTVLPTASGKYENAVSFERDNDDPSTAYITLIRDSKTGSGKIILKGLEIQRSANSEYGNIHLKVSINGDEGSSTVAKYAYTESNNDNIVLNDIDVSSSKPTISGTAFAGRTVSVNIDNVYIGKSKVAGDGTWSVSFPNNVKALSEGNHRLVVGYKTEDGGNLTGEIFKDFTTKKLSQSAGNKNIFYIGKTYYFANGIRYELDTAPYIDKNGRTMLPLRAVANAVGINDKNIIWDNNSQTATLINNKGLKVSVTIGSDVLSVGGREVTIDTEAVTINGRTMLPMRAMLNAFGIEDKNIAWDDAGQIVTFFN